MLKSLRNHKARSAACRYYHNQPEDSVNGGLLVRAEAENKNQVSHDDWLQ